MSNTVMARIRKYLDALQRHAARISPVAIFSLCLVVTLISFLTTQHLIQKDEASRFDRTVQGMLSAIEVRLRTYENVLVATRNFFSASEFVDRKEFHDFIEGFQVDKKYPGIQGIGYTHRLSKSELAKHEAQVRKSGFLNYRVWPDTPRDEYFSIIYLEPFDWRNQRAFGYDMFSEPVRRRAMELARDTGAPVSSGKVTLVQETNTNRQSGFLIYVPIYKNGMPVKTVEQRRKALQGFVHGPFRAGDLFENIARDASQDFDRVDFSIYDETSENGHKLLFHSGTTEEFNQQSDERPSHEKTMKVSLVGHEWTVKIRSTSQFDIRSEKTIPYFILVFGLIISCLIAFVTYVGKSLNQNMAAELEFRKQAEQDVLEARKAAENANHAKSRFLANMSHEIRTPLGIMIGFTDLALETPDLKQDLRNYLQSIKRNGQQLMTLIGEVLDLSKIEANKLDIESMRFSLPNLLEELFSSLSLRAREKGIVLKWDQSHEIPECITTDPTKLRQILTNLIGNSIKFTEHGQVCVTPRVLGACEKGKQAKLEFLIEDTGIGISEEQKQKLFQSFTQADASTTRRYGGTGLGLVLSQHLARALGGDVQLLHSQPGKGSTFSFQISVGPFEGYWQHKPFDHTSHAQIEI